MTFDKMRYAGVPDAIADKVSAPSFDRTVPAVRAARTAADTATRLLIYSGGSGTGKTCAAGVAAALMTKPGRQTTILVWADKSDPGAFQAGAGWYVHQTVEVGGCDELRGRWLDASACGEHLYDEAWWTRSRLAPVLVIDDLGLEGDGRVRDRMIGLIVERENHGRPTIVTTNLGPDAFKRTYCAGAGERLATRIDRGMWVNVTSRPAPLGTSEAA